MVPGDQLRQQCTGHVDELLLAGQRPPSARPWRDNKEVVIERVVPKGKIGQRGPQIRRETQEPEPGNRDIELAEQGLHTSSFLDQLLPDLAHEQDGHPVLHQSVL
jgi:hypothetical protein